MLSACRLPAGRPLSLLRPMSTAAATPTPSASTKPSSSSVPRSPRPRRPSNVPQVDVDYTRPHLDLVAQPDPISNLRPILYKQTDFPPPPRTSHLPPRPQPVPRPAHHSASSEAILSLSQFKAGAATNEPHVTFYRKDEFPREGDESKAQKEYRVVREALDEYNQAFWASNNTRYHVGLNAELAKLTPSDPPSHADEEARIAVVDAWNARWVEQESDRQRRWMKEWWGGQIGVLKAWWAMKREVVPK